MAETECDGDQWYDFPPADLLWGYAYIWRNDGDEAVLYDDADRVVDSYSY